METIIKYDFENAEKIYKELLELFNDSLDEFIWNGNEDNVFENEPDGEIYLEDGGIININAGFNSDYYFGTNNKYFTVEVVESSELIEDNISNIEDIISKYPEWEFVY